MTTLKLFKKFGLMCIFLGRNSIDFMITKEFIIVCLRNADLSMLRDIRGGTELWGFGARAGGKAGSQTEEQEETIVPLLIPTPSRCMHHRPG